MFGIGNSKVKNAKVGAREKIRLARELAGAGGQAIMSKREGKETSAAVSVITIYIMAFITCWMISEKYISSGGGLNMRLGWEGLDRVLFKTSNINVTGTDSLDYILLVAIRAFALVVAAGIIPFVALVVQKSLDAAHMNPFRAVWGTPIGIMLFIVGVKEYIGPILLEIFGMT